MVKRLTFTMVIAAAAAAAAAAQQTAKPASAPASASKPMSDQDLIKLAASAGPADITANATIVDHGADGTARTLRKGANGWVCMTRPEVMCLDKQWQEWADAWMNKRAPKVSIMGVAYMLQGDNGASNTDPFATAPTPSNQWVVTPPHIMVLTPDAKLLDNLPASPINGGPFVMWKGTPYAHLMIPVAPMAKK